LDYESTGCVSICSAGIVSFDPYGLAK